MVDPGDGLAVLVEDLQVEGERLGREHAHPEPAPHGQDAGVHHATHQAEAGGSFPDFHMGAPHGAEIGLKHAGHAACEVPGRDLVAAVAVRIEEVADCQGRIWSRWPLRLKLGSIHA
jgi:hypothetical protein